MSVRSPLAQQRRSCLFFSSYLLLVLALIGATAFTLVHFSLVPHLPCIANCNSTPTPGTQPINATIAPDHELIGLSDGRYAFDTGGADGSLKLQAAAKLREGDTTDAEGLWQQALNLPNESNDAEALIYLEDQRVLASQRPYITFVVGTILTGGAGDIGTGRDDLQGAYVAQKYYNDGYKLPGGVLVRLLIANTGEDATYVPGVAQQIVQAANADHTIAGVLGWPYSGHSLAAIKILGAAHIPMVSQTASSDALTGISPYFFRVAPANNAQAIIGAKFAEQQLQATRVAIFVDPKNSYSSSLAQDFADQFKADGNQVVAIEDYTVHTLSQSSAKLPALLQSALNAQPDLIYFAGYSDDMGTLLTDLGTSDPTVQVMGGDALYQLNGYPTSARPAFHRLRFTAFAYPDEWDFMGLTAQKPVFFTLYAADFDPSGTHPAYDYERPENDAILSYDAMLSLLQGANSALTGTSAPITPGQLQQNLARITVNNAIQGVSGRIAFGSDGNPVSKAVVILYVGPTGFIKLYAIKGCFYLGSC